MVGIPGSDLIRSAEWDIREGTLRETYLISAPSGSGQTLTTRDGTLSLADPGTVGAVHGDWRLESVGDGSGYRHIVEAGDSTRGLLVAGDPQNPGADLDVAVGPIRSGDRTAMWLLQDQCVPDARSIHLRYEAPSDLTLLYNEVLPRQAPPGTFFCTSGFGIDARGPDPGGYAGIQQLIDGRRIAIFSVWHRLLDDERPVNDALATAVAVNSDAYETPFSGEGSGTSIRLPIDWRIAPNEPVRLVVTAEPLGNDTVLTAYLARGSEPWISLGAIVRGGTGGRLMSRPYAFIEDFARTGNTDAVPPEERSPYRIRSASFSNPWIGGPSGVNDLKPVVRAEVTAYSPHPSENLAADQLERFAIMLATGIPGVTQPPPIGATLRDRRPQDRTRPNLGGIPLP